MLVIYSKRIDQGIRQTSENDMGPDQPHKEAPHICQDEAQIRSYMLVVTNSIKPMSL
jgi:hypothetical protein